MTLLSSLMCSDPNRQASLNSVHIMGTKCATPQQELEAEADHSELTLVPGAISSVMNGIGENSMETVSCPVVVGESPPA